MSDPEHDPDASNPLLEFGRELRRLRLDKGLTLEQVAIQAGYSSSLAGMVERGIRNPPDALIRQCEVVLGLEPRHLFKLLPAERRTSILRSLLPWMEIERRARELWTWEPTIVPGLLQTPKYAETILSGKPGVRPDQVEEAVQSRMARQALFRRDDPPTLWAVLDEGILHRPVGSEDVIREQLAHLLEMAHTPWVTIQILPYSAMSTAGLLGGFMIAMTRGRPDAAYVDSPILGRIWDQPPEVEALRIRYQTVRSEALPQSLSLERITKRLEQEWSW
ncbi:helix-turn-helix transcriptional regulator [Nonomuraea sp. NPDC048916]|uniref:helix-turn-helix domain-containing protein n=1 Tax=Nonomuraea sp. NPDC048916 TaxID=3154232 RepID=UPI0033BFC6FB